MEKYFGSFGDVDSVRRAFGRDGDATFPTDEEIVFAAYGEKEAYSGDGILIWRRDGKLFETSGSHCSCNGLEESWQPEETTPDALGIRKLSTYDHEADAIAAFESMFPGKRAS
jgi:hypothetical protein